ncbi:thiol reductant ABC exporter subunit CydD [Saccharopolyspora erythraea]|uniref:thiol reductant ABC exporter subunit CydD n=1 Tax=Saccharopolyspora erythraea TaxID=1836 RepID=UPI001BA57854|nr:thiol reductant ABC exporter subunit CydD [Saccharopolyspora erythraea]QUG99519.1 thiol reductant ABC exporter subunit CydD [Saccharopolyspora erythraea]
MSPLGALPKLSRSARRALVVAGALALGNAVALIVQAWALATALAAVVTTGTTAIGDELVVLAGAVVARAAFGWATEAVSARAAAGAKEELRAVLLDSALRRGPEWIRRRGAAELTALATKGLDALDAYFTKYLPALVTAGVVPLLVGAWILFSDWVSALAIVITVPLIPLFAWLVGRYTERRTARAADAVQRLSGQLLELIRALPVLTAFGRARAQGEVVRRVGETHRRTTGATLRIAFLSALVLELFSSLSVALVAVGIGLRLVSGDLDLATGLLVLVLAPECYLPLRAAGAAHHASEDGVEAVRRVEEVVEGSGDTRPARSPIPDEFTVRVSGLRVARRDGYAPDGLGFTARPGEVLRLEGFDGIGPSGSGKSTTFAALLGFASPESGSITCGGADIADLDPRQWRRLLAWVPQRPVFTGGTVLDELALAVADADVTADRALAGTVLAEVAGAHLVDRRIDELSTGERQRVAVARALLRLRGGARVLLLDEPTAHLDAATAHRVDAAVRAAADRGTTVILASHRPRADAEEAASAEVSRQHAAIDLPEARGRVRELLTPQTLTGVALGGLSLLSGLALAATSAWLIARASQQPPVLMLSVAVVGVRTFALSRAALRYLERLVTHDAAFRLSGRLRRRLWDALVRIGPVRSAGLRRGDGVARLVDDVDAVRDLVPRVLVPPLIALVVVIGAVAIQTAVLPAAGALLAGCLLAAGIAGPVAAVLADRRATTAAARGRRRVAAQALELLDGSAELLAFGADRQRRARLADEDARVLGGAWLGAQAVAGGRLAPELAPLLALVPLAAAEAVALLAPAAQQWRSLREAQARVAPLLAAEDSTGGVAPVAGEDIELTGVGVRWPGSEEPALRDVELRVPAGTHVAVVGPSGGGKSTLLALLLGFLRAERGEVRVPAAVSWCPQDAQLVSTTIRENLRIAAPRATDDELAEALRIAGLPGWGLDHLVESGGAALSGGEAQRVALARALLARDAELVLLDEPTAHLDVPTSEALLERLHEAFRGRTVVHVTHRWAETDHADIVLRVEGGEVTVLRDAPARPDAGRAAVGA